MDFIHPITSLMRVVVPLKAFITLEKCPPGWETLDIYLFRDDETSFYVGKSEIAFDRVWQHIHDGFKGRSGIGRFILCNWPESMNFYIELLHNRHKLFREVGGDLSLAEQLLINQNRPCFNVVHNPEPTPLPEKYRPYHVKPVCSRRLSRLISESKASLQAEKKIETLQEFEVE
jgi:hypothetical protein